MRQRSHGRRRVRCGNQESKGKGVDSLSILVSFGVGRGFSMYDNPIEQNESAAAGAGLRSWCLRRIQNGMCFGDVARKLISSAGCTELFRPLVSLIGGTDRHRDIA
jgi:hypothetical protein